MCKAERTLLLAMLLEKLNVLRLNFVAGKWWEDRVPPSAIPIILAASRNHYYEVLPHET